MKKIRIISLGEIVTPTLMNGLNALANKVVENSTTEFTLAIRQVQTVLVSQTDLIDNFKQGLILEDEFDNKFIEALERVTSVKITPAEFNEAWSSMNSKYAEFKSALKTALEFDTKINQQLIIMSYTNPKDIRYLTKELVENNIPHLLDSEGNLSEIAGMKLYLTYNSKTNKAVLLERIVSELNRPASPRNNLFLNPMPMDIKYIHGVNKLQLEALQREFDKLTLAIQETANKFHIDVVLWNKQSVKLDEILAQDNPESTRILATSI